MGTSLNHMLFIASKITHSRHRVFFLRTRELNEHHTPNASQSTEISASSENTVLLHYKAHINKHLKAVYEVFNYTLNVILLSARRTRLNNAPHAVLTMEHRELQPSCCQKRSFFAMP